MALSSWSKAAGSLQVLLDDSDQLARALAEGMLFENAFPRGPADGLPFALMLEQVPVTVQRLLR